MKEWPCDITKLYEFSSCIDEFGQPDALEYHTNVDFRVRRSRFLEVSLPSDNNVHNL